MIRLNKKGILLCKINLSHKQEQMAHPPLYNCFIDIETHPKNESNCQIPPISLRIIV